MVGLLGDGVFGHHSIVPCGDPEAFPRSELGSRAGEGRGGTRSDGPSTAGPALPCGVPPDPPDAPPKRGPAFPPGSPAGPGAAPRPGSLGLVLPTFPQGRGGATRRRRARGRLPARRGGRRRARCGRATTSSGTGPRSRRWLRSAWPPPPPAAPAVGTCVLQLPLRHAPSVAKEAATLSHLADGRLVLGVGVGTHPGEYVAAGRRLRRPRAAPRRRHRRPAPRVGPETQAPLRATAGAGADPDLGRRLQRGGTAARRRGAATGGSRCSWTPPSTAAPWGAWTRRPTARAETPMA